MPQSGRLEHDAKYSLVRELLRSGRSVRMKVRGTSMVPSLWPGDLVTIDERPATDLRLGDLVLVQRHARVYLHRVIGLAASRNGPFVLTQGDALSLPDPPASDAEVLGVLTAIERGGRVLRPSRARSLWNRSVAAALGSSANLLNWTLRLRQQYIKCVSEEVVLEPAV